MPVNVLSLASNSVKEGIANSGVPIKIIFKDYLFAEIRSETKWSHV
jgi:hypothetical protein